MTSLILHPVTREQVDNFTATPAHAVMICGPSGSGKKTVAHQIVAEVLGISEKSLAGYPYKSIISSEEGKAIGIEDIRSLEHFLSLKVPRAANYNRAIIINDAHLLTVEAQNAFLKTLEEPPAGTIIVLGVNNEQSLLPTIRSRTQSIYLKRPDRQILESHFEAQNYDSQAVKQAFSISGGLVGLMHCLLTQADHPLTAATTQARQLLNQSAYVRLLSVDLLSKQKTLATDTA